ncbi:MAG: hypothetical protein ACTSRD_15525 [Promethearchaeota archaeon]
MSDSNHLNGLNSLLDTVKLTENEIQEIYQLLGENEIETFMNELQSFGETLPEDADEFQMLQWLKTLSQESPKTYDILQRIIRENRPLFDKIQEIFIEKIL